MCPTALSASVCQPWTAQKCSVPQLEEWVLSRAANPHHEQHRDRPEICQQEDILAFNCVQVKSHPCILALPGSSPGLGNDSVWTPGALTRLASPADASFHLQEANGTRRRPDVGARLGRSLPSLPLISEVVLGTFGGSSVIQAHNCP